MNRLGVLDLPGLEVALRVLRELIGQNEQRIERRAQLVRHVCEELGFVFGRERQLFGLLFQRLAGLFHFRIFAFHFRVLLGEQFRLFLQLAVGVLQFLLPALQFLGQRLRLLEQIFRSGIRLNGVQHDADGFHKLIEDLRSELEKSPDEVVRQVIERSGYAAMLQQTDAEEDEERYENVQELITAAAQFAREDASRTIGDFLETITLASDVDSWDESADHVSVMTLHAAKGLEFPVVYLLAV